MRLPWTLSLYIGRQFFLSVLLGIAGLVALSMLIDVVELLRRASGKEIVTLGVILRMTLLKMPTVAEKLSPYAVLIGSMMTLTKLTRTHELVIARAAGISVWQFLGPAISVVMVLGVFMTTVFGPFAAVLLLRYEQLESKYFSNNPSMLSVSSSGLWLRQIEADGGEHIIYSMRISQSDMSFSNLIVFAFDPNKKFTERLDAKRAVLESGKSLHLFGVIHSIPGKPPEEMQNFDLPTTLTLTRIQDSFASPETMSFWHLPAFIEMLENAGFSALRHRLYWQSLLANPFLMAGTVLVAAVFSLRMPRNGRVGVLVVAGVIAGFTLHFFTDIIFALGSAGTLPVWLAAWAPATVVTMIGAAMLLHLEDG